MIKCRHTGPRSGIACYSRASYRLRFVEVCDACGAECREVAVFSYIPRYQRTGEDGHATGHLPKAA